MSMESTKYLPLAQRTEAELIRELGQLEATIRELTPNMFGLSYTSILELHLSIRCANDIRNELENRTLRACV